MRIQLPHGDNFADKDGCMGSQGKTSSSLDITSYLNSYSVWLILIVKLISKCLLHFHALSLAFMTDFYDNKGN